MTNPAFNPEDPRLTAFVLGEIDDSDRAEIEQLLETSPAAQAAVKEIEETIGVLKEGLAAEPVPELTAEQRAVVEEQLAGGVAASATSMPVTDGSVDRTQRAGARFGKLAGVVASVCALVLLVTFALPAIQNSDPLLVSSRLSDSENADQMMAMASTSEMEESFTVDVDREMVMSAETVREPRDEILSFDEFSKLSLASEESQLPIETAQLKQQIAKLKAVEGKESGGSRPSSTSQPFAEGRSENDFAKRDSAQPDSTSPGKISADYDRAARPKNSSGLQSAQRLIADTGSRPRSDSSRRGGVAGGAAAPRSGNPTAAPVAEGKSESKNDGQESSFDRSLSGNSPPKGFRPPPPASGDRATNKLTLASELAGAAAGKSVEGPRVDAPRPGSSGPQTGNGNPAKPQSRRTIVRNQLQVGGNVVTTESALGGAAADSPVRPIALLPVQQKQNKKILESVFSEAEVAKGNKTAGRGSGRNSPAPTSKPVTAFGVDSGVEGHRPDGDTAADREVDRLSTLAKRRLIEELRGQLQQVELARGISKAEKEQRVVALLKAAERQKLIKDFTGGRGFRSTPDPREQLDLYQRELRRKYHETGQKLGADKLAFGFGNETYEAIVENDFIVPVLGDKEKSLSTISIDVDTASYANMRRFLNRDQLPPANSVRIEELVNYFKYDYPEPEGDEPFSVKTELASCPWQPNHRLAMVGLKAKTIDKAQRPPTNLVFLLDVSGSMRSSNKLPLVQQSMRLLVAEMTEDDRISIVTYASNAGVRLQSTVGSKKAEILAVIDGLRAGGSTNGEGGIRMAYDEANRHYFQGGANRVILCSDGDFNVGKSSDGELVELIQEKAASGVFLSVFGFGMGNLKDAKLEKLADKGNGHYGYIDNVNEARKVFQDELVGTLYTVAKDVKLQVEFNPATVGAYRLIGYENRKLAAQDFADDTKDAGEIGSGHTVTALYEIIPKRILLEQPSVDGLKYQAASKKPAVEDAAAEAGDKPAEATETQAAPEELLTVKLRYKKPDEEVSQPVQQDFVVTDIEIAGRQLSAVSDDLMFAASVASFGMNLRRSKYRGNWGFAEVLETAQGAQSDFDQAQRTEFVQLVERAMRITGQQVGPQPRTNQGTTTRPGELSGVQARVKASVDGKYRRLVKKIEVRDDFQRFGAFNDYGHWDGDEYAGHKDIPPGNWVYVYPNWYIWAEAVVPSVETKPEAKPTVEKAAETKPAVK
jgi:Ca-activated chloride channel family protein